MQKSSAENSHSYEMTFYSCLWLGDQYYSFEWNVRELSTRFANEFEAIKISLLSWLNILFFRLTPYSSSYCFIHLLLNLRFWSFVVRFWISQFAWKWSEIVSHFKIVRIFRFCGKRNKLMNINSSCHYILLFHKAWSFDDAY